MDEIDRNHADNLSDSLMTLQSGLNELIRNAYLVGFKDGQEFERKILTEEANEQRNEQIDNAFSELKPDEARVLTEAEEILRGYS